MTAPTPDLRRWRPDRPIVRVALLALLLAVAPSCGTEDEEEATGPRPASASGSAPQATAIPTQDQADAEAAARIDDTNADAALQQLGDDVDRELDELDE